MVKLHIIGFILVLNITSLEMQNIFIKITKDGKSNGCNFRYFICTWSRRRVRNGKGGIKHEKISYKQYYYQYFFYC